MCSSLPSSFSTLPHLTLSIPTSFFLSGKVCQVMYCPYSSSNRVQHFILKQNYFRASLRGCLGAQPLRCGAEVSNNKGNALHRQRQEKMINYKAAERQSMCWCVQTGGGNGKRDNLSGRCEVQQKGREKELRMQGAVEGGVGRWSSCAKWLAVLKQKCVFQQEM